MRQTPPQAKLIFHLPLRQLDNDMADAFYFYKQLRELWQEAGGICEAVRHEKALTLIKVERDSDFHFCDHGWERHPRILNTGHSYIAPYWNCDPKGIRAMSRIGQLPFRPSQVDRRAAQRFTRKLSQKLVDNRRSRYKQPETENTSLPTGAVAVFLQSEAHRSVEETLYLNREQMVRAVCSAGLDRPIIIKPHPMDPDPKTGPFLEAIAAEFPHVTISRDNIHDLFKAADVTVTINSATAIEGFLHHVPAVLCGKADFRHRMETVRRGADMRAAIEKAIAHPPPFEKYLTWYFGSNCLNPRAPDFLDRVLAKISETGFDTAAFGLR